ncbi:hypothetical protein MASR1M32_42420 [Rhodobacter sp.]
MRKFTIVGGGQSGLMVAIGLLKAGHKVRVVQNRTGEDIAKGKVLSSQCMFSNAVQHERDLGSTSGPTAARPCRASTSSCRTRTARAAR